MAKFSDLIEPSELWGIKDASKSQDYSLCRRKYMFRHVFGWKNVNETSIHLEFGTAVHFAMEVLATDGYNAEAMAKAYAVFLEHYRKFFDPLMDEHNGAKVPANFLRALPQYVARYKKADEKDEVLHVETAGSVPISDKQTMHWKMDTICRNDALGYFSLEHKTGSNYGTSWEAGWRQKIQVGVYSHVLYSMFPEEEVYGVIINGMFIRNEPKLKKDGTPYSNARDNEFHRVPVRMTPEQLQGWLVDMIDLLEDIDRQHDRLADTSDNNDVLQAFPRNREACTQYGICPYLNVCSTNMNPVRGVGNPPLGYEVDRWDPRDIPTVKERLEL